MWVMNQDEDEISFCSCVAINPNNPKRIEIISGGSMATVAQYNTKERAKRVLLDLSLAIATDKKIFYMPKE